MTRPAARLGLLFVALSLGCASPRPAFPAPKAWLGVTRLMDSLIAAGAAPGAVLSVSIEGRHLYHGTGRQGSSGGSLLSTGSFGHTGFTGTST